MLFTGEYEHTIDTKHRLAIPAELRARIDPDIHGSAMYLVPGPNGALWLWPQTTFEKLAKSFNQTLLPPEELMEFEELLFSQAHRLEVDRTGRVRLPERLLKRAGLGQTVIIIGVRDHLELRDPDEWNQRLQRKLATQSEIMLRARAHMNNPRTPGATEP